MTRLVTLILFLFYTAAFSQSGFYSRVIDFSRPENARWQHPPHENLGTMLLDAHLRGEIKAYKFDIAHDVMKYAPIPKEELASPWDPKLDYYMDDMVSHKGAMYIANVDINRGGRPPDSLGYWQDLQMHGDVVSMRHHFPDASDSTTKSYLLSRLVEQGPEGYEKWVETYEYFTSDRVEHEGKMYVARGNNFAGIIPGTNQNYWEELRSRVTMFQPTDLNVVSVLYHDHTPQMVSIRVLDPLTEAHKNLGLNFFYNDVVKYLAKANQPALYLSDLGHVGGGTFLFDDHTKVSFTRWLQAKIISKEIKPGKKAVLNPVEYNLFMSTKPEDMSQATWFPVQNPATRDFTIITGKVNADHDYYTLPVLSITYASIEKSLKALPAPAKPKSYKDIFADTFLTSWIDTVAMDSIDALPAVAAIADAFKQIYFDQVHFDNTEANPIVMSAAPALWELIKQNKTRFLSSQSYYPCRYNWKGAEIHFQMSQMIADEKLSISHVIPPPADLPKPEWKMKEIGIVYRINLNTATERFYPVQLVISFEEEAHADLIDYRIDWQDVLKLVSGKKEYDAFIDGAKKASLNFKQTAIAYDLFTIR